MLGRVIWTEYWEAGFLSDYLACELGALGGIEAKGTQVGGVRSSYCLVQDSRQLVLVLVGNTASPAWLPRLLHPL